MTDQPEPTTDEVRQLLVHPVVWPHLTSWLTARGIDLSQKQFAADDLPTYVMTPSDTPPVTDADQIGVYTQIFKKLPRQWAALLVAAITTDPELHGRRTAIAQAAMLVSVGWRLGWTDTEEAQR